MKYERFGLYPKGTQMEMTGNDWTSERDKKRLKKAQAKREVTAKACAKKLEAAAASLYDYLRACNDCEDESGDERMGMSDCRRTMASDLLEYAAYLNMRY